MILDVKCGPWEGIGFWKDWKRILTKYATKLSVAAPWLSGGAIQSWLQAMSMGTICIWLGILSDGFSLNFISFLVWASNRDSRRHALIHICGTLSIWLTSCCKSCCGYSQQVYLTCDLSLIYYQSNCSWVSAYRIQFTQGGSLLCRHRRHLYEQVLVFS